MKFVSPETINSVVTYDEETLFPYFEGKRVYFIPEANLGTFNTRFGKLVKKAKKVKVAEPTYTTHFKTRIEVVVEYDRWAARDKTAWVNALAITVEGPKPVIDGWTFVASILHTATEDDRNLVVSSSDIKLPTEYKTADNSCDHCGHKRFRKNTFVLVNEAGEFKKVGSTCLKDFIGNMTAASIANWATIWWTFENDMSEGWGDGEYKGESFISLSAFMNYVAKNVRLDGRFLSISKCRDEWGDMVETPTVDKADWDMECVNSDASRDWSVEKRTEILPTVEDVETATEWIEAIREYADGLTEEEEEALEEYEWNLITVTAGDALNKRAKGLAASLAAWYWRRFTLPELEATRVNYAETSEWVGTVKERLRDLKVTVLSANGFEGTFGWTDVFKFVDNDDNLFTWFSTSDVKRPDGEIGLKKGETFIIDGTVKAHNEYKGAKETLLNRCKVKEVKS